MKLAMRLKRFIFNNTHSESPRMLFNILISFLATFLLAHAYSLVVPFYVFIRGYHIHHFYYGMFILAITSITAILTNRDNVRHGLSYFIGIGIGLIVDELGLLLTCTSEHINECSYLFPNTFDAVLIVALILTIFIFFGDKPIRWFLPKSIQNNKTLNKNIQLPRQKK
jgi:hypothetical protein